MFIRIISAALCLLFILASCSNESESNPVLTVYKGTIKGFVYDATTNQPIYYAKITTQPPTKETYTGSDGEFILNDILAGDYIVDAHKDGFDNDTTFVAIQQKDTINTVFALQDFSIYLDYYPLEIGNYWEYWSSNEPRYSLEVISDTVISGKIYWVIEHKNITSQYVEFRYERVDAHNALVYRYFPSENQELLIDSMAAKVGQGFTSNMFFDPYRTCTSTCYTMEEKEIFGEIWTVRN
jgi:hypothetical protein